MYNKLKILVSKFGIDKAIAYSSGSRFIQGLTGVASVFFITTYLTGIEQGFYYTFGSILALQVFFELGLTGIMTQYVAHEASHLHLNKNWQYEGEGYYRSRLASLLHFCVKWYAILALLVFVFLVFVGFIFFSQYGDQNKEINWQLPWILICIGTAVKLFQAPLTAIYYGLGMVNDMSKIGFYQQIILPLSTWLGLVCGLKLYVIGIGYIISVVVWLVCIHKNGLRKILLNLWREEITDYVGYFKEIFPYQWRIALSWISGYFIFQLFNPVLFATEGAVVAGKMGMTLQALNAIQALSMSWINTKIPLYSKLIALKDYYYLDKIFKKTLRQMSSVCMLLLALMFLIIWMLNVTEVKFGDNKLADRFLGYIPMLLMMIPIYLQQYVYSWATYLRCHKQEPFLLNSICGGVACCLSTLILGNLLGLYGITIGYCIISILLFLWAYHVYKVKKKQWHEK